jgi:hypothetical protein
MDARCIAKYLELLVEPHAASTNAPSAKTPMRTSHQRLFCMFLSAFAPQEPIYDYALRYPVFTGHRALLCSTT